MTITQTLDIQPISESSFCSMNVCTGESRGFGERRRNFHKLPASLEIPCKISVARWRQFTSIAVPPLGGQFNMKSYNIAVIAGDGTGPEVIREAVKVLDA